MLYFSATKAFRSLAWNCTRPRRCLACSGYSIKTGNLLLMPVSGSTDPLVQLFKCRNLLVEKRGLIYQGIEDRWQRKAKESFPQALWCWPSSPEPMSVRFVPPTTSVIDDLREAMR